MVVVSEDDKEAELKKKTRKLSVFEGGIYSLHDGFGLRYLTPYALAIGRSNPYVNFYVGLLSSVPSLIGNLSQLWTIKAIEKYKRKKILFVGVILQALMWLMVLFSGALYFVFGFDSNLSLIFLVFSFTLMVLFGSFVGPVWVSLMQDNVPHKRGNYFSKRSMFAGLVSLVAFMIAGWLLDFLTLKSVFFGFFVLFLIAFFSRFVSGITFLFHYEPQLKFDRSNYFSFYSFLKKMPSSNFAKFTLFVSLFVFATSIASPFFPVYVLKNLGFSYFKWTITALVVSVSALLFMPFWGYFIDSYGNIKTLKLTGLFIPLLPLLWIFTLFFDPVSIWLFVYIIFMEILSGMLWSGFNLAAGNFIYDAVSRQKVPLCSSYFSILQGIGVFLGATLGGLISSMDFTLFGLSSILIVFMLSGILRFSFFFILSPKIKDVRDVRVFKTKEAFNEFIQFHTKPVLSFFNYKTFESEKD